MREGLTTRGLRFIVRVVGPPAYASHRGGRLKTEVVPNRPSEIFMASKSPTSKSLPPAPVTARATAVQPNLHQQSHETQKYGEIVKLPNGLSEKVCKESVALLNQCLADTITLRDMYKKHHWQVVGPTFNQLHLMYDQHFEAQVLLVDILAERIQLLGGIALAMAADVAESTKIARPPRGREPAAVQIRRLAEAHEMIIIGARDAAKKVDDAGDDGSNDVFVSNVLRTNELQVWFLTEHLVAASPVTA
jgi:starvation-inducible DNA-binding protein